jgi:dTDP-L-rhamnose 4-epimerase
LNVLITGGAGFIGRRLGSLLLERGHAVTALDALDPQVHRKNPLLPKHKRFRFVKGDVRDRAVVSKLVGRSDAVVHFAAAVGVGQSQYRIEHFLDVNVRGTGIVLEAIASSHVKKLIIAGSASSYGEGTYRCDRCGRVTPPLRTGIVAPSWEPCCPSCAYPATAVPIREDDPRQPGSVYAVSKSAQEELGRNFSAAYGVPTVIFRFFNVIGPGQSLGNPYTGIAAIIVSASLAGKEPFFYEDGRQSRDFVSVHDVAWACAEALDTSKADGHILNLGTGRATSVLELSEKIAKELQTSIKPVVLGKFRSGDIRHCIADISRAKALLGYCPRVSIDDAVKEFVDWSSFDDARGEAEKAHRELLDRGLA